MFVLLGYVGENCISACDLITCSNGGTCVLDASVARGYSCRCADGYHGDECQYSTPALKASCPDNWFGSDGICGPCNCSVKDNFDAKCDPVTGACRCKVSVIHDMRCLVFHIMTL